MSFSVRMSFIVRIVSFRIVCSARIVSFSVRLELCHLVFGSCSFSVRMSFIVL